MFFYLIELLFSGFFQFKGNFVRGQNTMIELLKSLRRSGDREKEKQWNFHGSKNTPSSHIFVCVNYFEAMQLNYAVNQMWWFF